CLARKPLVGTVAANMAAHGTGCLNIDGCRIATGESTVRPLGSVSIWGTDAGDKQGGSDAGRWPANIIHDGSDEVLAAFPAANGGHWPDATRTGGGDVGGGTSDYRGPGPKDEQGGSAARFFYCAKAT